ncbi:MAG: 8-amino-7-oxononanoate synthase [Deltaproteobacteria bacterium]|nr:MAG: 8-amino-7-oxononanoate synthase [Deltaproteobacteria bacterium]
MGYRAMAGADEIARAELDALRTRGLLRSLEPLRSPPGSEIELRPGERLINFSSNDYLGLASDARIAEALAVGTRTWGAGAGASRLVCGDFLPQHELEAELARFASSEAALLFGSGYAANCGILPSFAGPEDLILSDALNHASIIDGCRLSRARVEVYPHGDVGAVEKALRAPARRKIVVTDAVFSMDGDRAPLRELAALCSAAGALLIVDEAHATGVIGPRGAGLAAELGVAADVRMATLSKAFGVAGAYVAASRAVCDLLLNRARPLIFSTALPPALACAARASLEILAGSEGDARRSRLWSNVRRFAAGLREAGLPAREDSAIFPVVTGTPDRALAMAAHLRELGILAKPIRPPTVPQGTSRIRFAVTSAHTVDHIDRAIATLRAC